MCCKQAFFSSFFLGSLITLLILSTRTILNAFLKRLKKGAYFLSLYDNFKEIVRFDGSNFDVILKIKHSADYFT